MQYNTYRKLTCEYADLHMYFCIIEVEQWVFTALVTCGMEMNEDFLCVFLF